MWLKRSAKSAERSPTSLKDLNEERGQACYVHVRIVLNNHLHAERPAGEAWAWNIDDILSHSFDILISTFYNSLLYFDSLIFSSTLFSILISHLYRFSRSSPGAIRA
jgi:hypothetical protein